MTPEQRLWVIVLTGAILDCFSKSQTLRAIQEREDAIHFLTDETGSWAQSRKNICLILDFCPNILRRRILEIQSRKDADAHISELIGAIEAPGKKMLNLKRKGEWA